MQRRSRHRGRLTAAAALVLIGALGTLATACSSSPSGRPVASLPGTPSTTGAGSAPASSPGSYDQDIVAYTRCLRAHGVHEPDPVNETHNGKTGLSFVMPPANAANTPALAACNHYIANLVAAKQAGANHELARWLPSLVRYASCMRSHDVAMLDPGAQGQLNLGSVPGITNDFGRYSPQFRSADAACRHFLPAGVHDDGTGP
jgi:hypothetical protein